MLYELAVCLRYLRPRRSRAYISINTLISIIGIALGVMTLITVIAVMTGFGDQIKDSFTGFYSHIIVNYPTPEREFHLIRNSDELIQKIESISEVAAASPYVYGKISMQVGEMWYYPDLRAIDPLREPQVSTIKEHLIQGDFDFKDEGQTVAILVGKPYQDKLGLNIGDKVRIASTGAGSFGEQRQMLAARIAGIFFFGNFEQDASVYTSLTTGQILQSLGTSVHSISVKLKDVELADQVKKEIEKKLGPDYPVVTWTEINPELFDLIKQEQFIMYLIVALIVAVAALNIIASLSMTVMHKRKEIGILKSMGAKKSSITIIFGLSGLIIGIIATGLGIISGLLLSYNFNAVRDFVAKITQFKLFGVFETIPISLGFVDVFTIATIAIVLCIIASIYPAWKAARLNPVDVLRYE